MATIDIRQVHGTTTEEASQKTKALLARFAETRSEIVERIDWAADGMSARVTGRGFKGGCRINDRDIVIEIDLKFIARPFKGRIEDGLRRRLAQTFGA